MLKLHAGVSKKVGLPGFSSASASCTIEAELDGSLLHDRDGFQTVVQRAYQSCEQAVHDQIARLLAQGHQPPGSLDAAGNVSEQAQTTNSPQACSQGPSRASQHPTHSVPPQPEPAEVLEVRTSPAIQGVPVSRIPAAQFTSQPSRRPATVSQVKAIRAICSRRKINLVGLLRERFGLTTADELGIRQASDLIDELKGDSDPGSTTGANASSPGTSSPGTNGHPNGHQNGNGAYAGTGGTR